MKSKLKPRMTGIALAMAAAGLMASYNASAAGDSPVTAAAGTTDLVQCSGVNACKGHNDCKTANNSCAGMSSCKGHGFVAMPSKACGEMGGTVMGGVKGTVATADLVQCYGVNSCSGHNDCKTAENACAGKSSCKGSGFVLMGKKACSNVGGKEGV